MTDLLRTLLNERADALAGVPVDLDAIETDGRRRVRRRRVSAALGGAAAVAAVALTVSLLPWPGRSGPGPADGVPAAVPVYAVGSTLHVGDRTVDLGHPVGAMVQTATGVVFTSGRRVYQWDGVTTRLAGRWAGARADDESRVLFTNADGSLAAWIQPANGRPELGTVGAWSTDLLTTRGLPAGARVRAVDGDEVYVAAAGALRAYGQGSGQGGAGWSWTTTYPGVPAGAVIDVVDGGFLHLDPLESGDTGSVLSATPTGEGVSFRGASDGRLAPDGAHLFSESTGDTVSVFDTATGTQVDLRHPGMDWAAGTRWIDGRSFWAVGIRDEDAHDPAYSVLRCSLTAGSCSTVVRDAGGLGRLVAPNGYLMGSSS